MKSSRRMTANNPGGTARGRFGRGRTSQTTKGSTAEHPVKTDGKSFALPRAPDKQAAYLAANKRFLQIRGILERHGIRFVNMGTHSKGGVETFDLNGRIIKVKFRDDRKYDFPFEIEGDLPESAKREIAGLFKKDRTIQ